MRCRFRVHAYNAGLMLPSRGLALLVVLLIGAAGCAGSSARNALPAPSASLYIMHIQNGVDRARRQMPAITASADTAARRVITARGRVFVAGSQPEFAAEMIARTGGLACFASPPPLIQQFGRSDVVLYATRSRLSVADRAKIARWRDQGVYVIAFASNELSSGKHFPPDVLIDSGDHAGFPLAGHKILPTDTTLNLINAWTWTGEFIAACTRLGQTPIVHQSPDMPGGKERMARYFGRWFHDDLSLPPIERGALGAAYLDRIDNSLAAMASSSQARFQIGGAWLHEFQNNSAVALMTGPLFPDHFRDERAPQLFAKLLPLSRGTLPEARFVAVFGAEKPPQLQIEAAHLRRCKLFYSTVARGRDDMSIHIAYVDPRWPAGDACLKVRGYDVPILPASSIMQATIYWSLLAEAEREAWLERSS